MLCGLSYSVSVWQDEYAVILNLKEGNPFSMGNIWIDKEGRKTLEERYDLAMGRIREIEQEPEVPACFVSYVRKTAAFLLLVDDVKTKLENGYYEEHPEELKTVNRALYEDILPENYENSYGNPAYTASVLG